MADAEVGTGLRRRMGVGWDPGSIVLVVVLLLASIPAWPVPADRDSAGGLSLYTSKGRLIARAPRLQTDVEISVAGVAARTRIRQRFTNPTDTWLEGIYVFPLPSEAAVDHLRMRYDERLIEGEIQERDQAQRTYDRARDAGRAASLVSQRRANIFTTAVANIPPGETIEIEIGYQQPVDWQGDEYALRLPLVVAPRYIPGQPRQGERTSPVGLGWANDTDQVPDASGITPMPAFDVGPGHNPVRIDVDLHSGLPLAAIESPHHPIRVRQTTEGRYRVGLSAGEIPADRDFVLRWRPQRGAMPEAAVFNEPWEGRHYALLMVMPPPPDRLPARVDRELILVVDTSGSMHGASIEQAKAALQLALGQLGSRDRFNIIQFNSDSESLFRESRPADARHVAIARRYIAGLEAEGGTEMLPAMHLALRDPDPREGVRQVVFLTDGSIGNEQALFDRIRNGLGRSRLFTVGIGSAPNGLFMRRAAAFGRGSFTFIGAVDEVEVRMRRLLTQLAAPVLTDIKLRWAGGDGVLQTPVQAPDLYAGEPLVITARAERVPVRVSVEGWFGKRRWRRTYTMADAAPAAGIHALWARRHIDDLTARQATGEDRERLHAEIRQTALTHQLVTALTSLVAVDRTPLRAQGEPMERSGVPVHLPAGWSRRHVFGPLPGTATPAPLAALIGVIALVLGLLLRARGG